jgi:mannosyltransferase
MTIQRSINYRVVSGLLLILAIALFLRIFMLSRQSLWLDEVASWWFAKQPLHKVLQSEPTNPPFYYFLLHFWIRYFGTSEAALRSLSILPSLFSVWLLYILARRLFDRGIAFIAAAYQAVSTFQIYYAQEARCFSLLVALLLLATLYLWKALESDSVRSRVLFFAVYAALSALALYTHFIAIFFLAGQGLYVLFRRPKQVLAAGSSMFVSLLLFSPWLVTMLRAAAGGGQTARRYLLLKLPQAYFSFLYGDSLIPLDDEAVRHIPETLRANWLILTAALLSVAMLIPFLLKACKRWGDRMVFLLVMAFVPVLLAFLVSFKVMLFDERYLIPASPFLYVIVAAAVWEIRLLAANGGTSSRALYAGWGTCGMYCILLALSLHNYYFNSRFGKEQWREADAYIDSLTPTTETAIIVFDPDYIGPCYGYYTTRNLPSWLVTSNTAGALRTSRAALDEHTGGYQHILLVRSHADEDWVLDAMTKAFTQESYRKFTKANPIEVYSFRP